MKIYKMSMAVFQGHFHQPSTPMKNRMYDRSKILYMFIFNYLYIQILHTKYIVFKQTNHSLIKSKS